MTSVIAIQGLVGALAGLLFVESRLRRREQARAACGGDDCTAPIDFHPELIVRWDDEANSARHTPCTRTLRADSSVAVRPRLTTTRSNTRIR